MADAERIDETVEADVTPLVDGVEQVAHRGFAVAFDLLELERPVARLQGEDVGGLLHPALLEEILDLLFAKALDIERAARHEQHQVLDLLERTGEFAGAACARSFLAGRRLFADHFSV